MLAWACADGQEQASGRARAVRVALEVQRAGDGLKRRSPPPWRWSPVRVVGNELVHKPTLVYETPAPGTRVQGLPMSETHVRNQHLTPCLVHGL